MKIKTIVVYPDRIELHDDRISAFEVLSKIESVPCDLDVDVFMHEEGMIMGMEQNLLIEPMVERDYFHYMNQFGGPFGPVVIVMRSGGDLPYDKIRSKFSLFEGIPDIKFQEAILRFLK